MWQKNSLLLTNKNVGNTTHNRETIINKSIENKETVAGVMIGLRGGGQR